MTVSLKLDILTRSGLIETSHRSVS